MKRGLIIRLLAALALLGSVFAVQSCNTIEGIGEDISAVGRGMSRGAERNRQY